MKTWLLPAKEGYLEADGIEKTWQVKQTTIAREVDILSSRDPGLILCFIILGEIW